MRQIILLATISVVITAISCSQKTFQSNGEMIYKTGRNQQGEKMLNKKASRIQFVNNCQSCHGKTGERLKGISIKFSYLSNPNNFAIPYTDSLFYRFLDHDLKSDGSRANIGVIWKMNNQDKKDLLDYLKSL